MTATSVPPAIGGGLIHHTPSNIRAPFAQYVHGVEVPPSWRWLACSGQLGVSVDDVIPASSAEQAALAFENVREVLTSARMTVANVVRINAFVTGRDDLAGYMSARDAFIADLTAPPASTLMIVGGFTRPELRVEVEILAAAPPRGETP